MSFFSFILRTFKLKPSWNGTPEMFLALVLDMQHRNNPVYSLNEVLQWGEVMQKVISVKLAPFKNFPDLLQNGIPDYTLVKKMGNKLDELNHRQELKKAIYGWIKEKEAMNWVPLQMENFIQISLRIFSTLSLL